MLKTPVVLGWSPSSASSWPWRQGWGVLREKEKDTEKREAEMEGERGRGRKKGMESGEGAGQAGQTQGQLFSSIVHGREGL